MHQIADCVCHPPIECARAPNKVGFTVHIMRDIETVNAAGHRRSARSFSLALFQRLPPRLCSDFFPEKINLIIIRF